LVTRQDGCRATLLLNGQVLLAGGGVNNILTTVTQLYDPTSRTWNQTGDLNTARGLHTATLLRNGQVLVAGGSGPLASAELYNPLTGTWSETASLNTARYYHTATLLRDGSVLVAGGFGGGIDVLASAELFRAASPTHEMDADAWPRPAEK
jgi:hypothetical protein